MIADGNILAGVQVIRAPAEGKRQTLPRNAVIVVTVFFWSHTGKFFEGLYKVALRRKCEIICNFNQAVVGIL